MQQIFTINEDENLIRLDIYLSNKLELSRNKIKNIIENKKVLLNGNKTKASVKLKAGDIINVDIEEEFDDNIMPQDIPLDIVYEDDNVLVVNKPRGMVTHVANGNHEGTLVNALLYYLKDDISMQNGMYRAGIVHRIDKDTSGLLVVAKNDFASSELSHQLKDHSMTRIYTLICNGRIDEDTIIEQNIGRNPKDRMKYCVIQDGKYAHTTIIPLEIFEKYTYAKAILKTGRTHQIRVHLRYINRPIVGDKLYSNYKEKIDGQLLHAGTLGFIHPKTKKYLEFSVEEPEIFKKELSRLRSGILH